MDNNNQGGMPQGGDMGQQPSAPSGDMGGGMPNQTPPTPSEGGTENPSEPTPSNPGMGGDNSGMGGGQPQA